MVGRFSILATSLFWGCISISFFDEDVIETCNGEKYTSVNQVCEDGVLKNKYPCGNSYYDPRMQFCNESTIFDKCNGNEYDPAIYGCCFSTNIFALASQKCEDDVLFYKCGDEWYNAFLKYCIDGTLEDIFINEKEFIDGRDNRMYKYVLIGTQIWMAENLQYETSNTKCYDNNPDNCKIYGILYDWNTAKTICPFGWHLPDDAEWNALENFVGSSNAGTRLKANSDIWISNKGTDDFGFTALPGGFYKNGFEQMRGIAGFWSATAGNSAGSAHFRYFSYLNNTLNLDGFYVDTGWAYVRCIKD